MVIRLLPLIAGLVPLAAVFGALWIGVANEVLPSCFPPLDGCISISATGRKPPGSFLFRSVMASQPVLLVVVWFYCVLWLRSLEPNLRRATAVAILTSGIVGAVAIVIYVTFLGTKEPTYEFMRRFGIYFGFLGTGIAQIISAVVLRRLSRNSQQQQFVTAARVILGLCMSAVALGILNMVLKRVLEDADSSENRIEWIVFVVMQCYFLALYYAWRITGFDSSVSTQRS